MFLASEICNGLLVNYSNYYDLPYSIRLASPRTSRNRIKNVVKNAHNPKTEYHKWLTSGTSCKRSLIIKKQNAGIYKWNTKKNKIATKAIALPRTQFRYTYEESDSEYESDSDNALKTYTAYSPVNASDSTDSVPTPDDIKDLISGKTNQEKIDLLFSILEKIRWCNSDRRVCNSINLYDNDLYTLMALMPTMTKLADELKISCANANNENFDNLTETEEYNFLFHCIAMGRSMYFTYIIDPEFCMYMLPDLIQPLYTVMINTFEKITM